MHSGEQTINKYLVQRSIKGDRSAQNELYKLHVNAMYNICRRMLKDPELAKDILQDSFIQAFKNINRLKNEVTFSAWLKRIVINNCINHLKKNQLLSYSLDDELDERLEEGFVDEELKNKNIKNIMAALEQISEGCRTVLNLYIFEGYDHKEIAQILNITESASKAQYSKAKSKIRKLLNYERG